MDLAYWNFRHWPFERTYAVDRFYSSPSHDEALARLLFLVEESRRTGLLVGPSGSGKTYLLKLVQQRSERLGRLTVRCDATGLSGDELVSQIATGCHALTAPDMSTSRIWTELNSRLSALMYIQHPIVVILDHFDYVDTKAQQAVCRLRQIADTIGVKLTLIIASREQKLVPGLLDLMELRTDLAYFTADEIRQFIRVSLLKAGSADSHFTEESFDAIHEYSRGVPTTVISISNLALLAAMGRSSRLVTSDMIEAAACELSLPMKPRSIKVPVPTERSLLSPAGV